MVVAMDAVTNGWWVLRFVAVVAIWMWAATAPAVPLSTAASFTLNRSERKQVPKPSSSARRTSSSSGAGVVGPPASP